MDNLQQTPQPQATEQTQPVQPPQSPFNVFRFVTIGLVAAFLIVGGYLLGIRQNQTITTVPQTLPTQPPLSPTPDPTADWKVYSNSTLNFSIKYPKDWFIDETNGVEYVRIQNYDPRTAPGRGYDPFQDKGKYLVTIAKWPKKQGIKTVIELKEELPKNGEQTYYIGNLETISVTNEKEIKLNGARGIYREVTYTQSQSIEKAAYLLDGKGLVLQVSPGLDEEGGKTYFDQILSTFKFTN